MPWGIAAAAIEGVAAIGSAAINSDASGKEVKEQQNALNQASAAQQQGYQQAQNYLNPYYQTGSQDEALYNSILTGTPLNQQSTYQAGFGATNGNPAVTPTGDFALANQTGAGGGNSGQYSAFFNSPDYQFQLQQGMQALNNSASASGNVQSGAQQMAITNYAQGLASQQYNSFMNKLATQAGTGQNAGTSLGNIAIGQGSALGGIAAQIGNVQAAGTTANANALTSGISGLTSATGTGSAGGLGGIISGAFGGGSSGSNSGLGALGLTGDDLQDF